MDQVLQIQKSKWNECSQQFWWSHYSHYSSLECIVSLKLLLEIASDQHSSISETICSKAFLDEEVILSRNHFSFNFDQHMYRFALTFKRHNINKDLQRTNIIRNSPCQWLTLSDVKFHMTNGFWMSFCSLKMFLRRNIRCNGKYVEFLYTKVWKNEWNEKY